MRIYMYQRLDPIGIKQSNWKKRLPVLGKFFEWLIFSVVLSLLVIIASPYLPTKKYFSSFIVSSGSMEPSIKTGSIALVMPIDPILVAVEDVIAFRSPEDGKKTILHRVRKITGNQKNRTFHTRGDNNQDMDKWQVRGNAIQGLMFFSIPYLGHLAYVIRTPVGFLVFIGIPGLLLIIWQIREILSGFY